MQNGDWLSASAPPLTSTPTSMHSLNEMRMAGMRPSSSSAPSLALGGLNCAPSASSYEDSSAAVNPVDPLTSATRPHAQDIGKGTKGRHKGGGKARGACGDDGAGWGTESNGTA
eukprot:Sspe_Gene.118580::Locus_112298_Transcript_1_1_Confidence_1.000_Length_404::g.118580::m.118580